MKKGCFLTSYFNFSLFSCSLILSRVDVSLYLPTTVIRPGGGKSNVSVTIDPLPLIRFNRLLSSRSGNTAFLFIFFFIYFCLVCGGTFESSEVLGKVGKKKLSTFEYIRQLLLYHVTLNQLGVLYEWILQIIYRIYVYVCRYRYYKFIE